ncbi:MAG: hypothetical protein WCK02_12770 [Bacteroidota bacterium]
MQSASISEIKKELKELPQEVLVNYCLHLAKYKKENKELLNYLLFEASDELAYIAKAKQEIENQFAEMNLSNTYLAKKTIRKVLRTANKYIKYSNIKTTEVELLIHFCKKLKSSGFSLQNSNAINNIYLRQIQKINQAIKTLHEDLQHDYSIELKNVL